MLIYGSNITVTKALPPLLVPKPINLDSWFTKIFFTVGRIFSQVLIYKISKVIEATLIAINPALGIVAGSAFLFLGSMITDTLIDQVENGSTDWDNVKTNLILNSLPFVYKSLRVASNISKNKIFRLGANLREQSLASQLRKTAYATQKIGLDKKIYNPNFRAYMKAEAILKKANISQLSNESFKRMPKEASQLRKQIMPMIKTARKSIFRTRQITSAVTSPEYAAKKGLDMLTRVKKRELVKKINTKILNVDSSWKQFLKQKFKRFGFLFDDSYLMDIPIQSRVIERIRLLPNKNKFDYSSMSFIIYFDQNATQGKNGKGKLPLLIQNKEMNKVLGFLTASSPFNYYLENFAWGWEIGKFLRDHKKFMVISNIPLYSNLINNIFWSARTFIAIKKSLAKNEWDWKEKGIGNKILKGLKDNALKSWNIKYIAPAIYIARGFQTKQKRYLTTTVMKQSNKQSKLFKTRLSLKNRKR